MTSSASNPLGWEVGQEVTYIMLGRYATVDDQEATITKVGRKYGEVVYRYENRYSDSGWGESRPMRFVLASGYEGGNTPYFRITTPELLAEEHRVDLARTAMEAGGLKWAAYSRCPLTADQMERIAAILNETKENA